MFKKILLSIIVLSCIFTTTLAECPQSIETQSHAGGGGKGGCEKFVDGENRYCNKETAITLYKNAGYRAEYERTFQQNTLNLYNKATQQELQFDLTTTQGICNIQKVLGLLEDGKLGRDTLYKLLNTDICSRIGQGRMFNGTECYKMKSNVQTQLNNTSTPTIEMPPAPNPAPQQTSKCGEHAYTCASGENPSDQKYNEKEKTCTRKCGETQCPEDGKAVKCSTYSEAEQQLGIGLNKDCLVHGGCSLDVYKTLGIRQNSEKETRTSVLSFFQDVIGASTFFIGTILTIAFVISGFRYVLAGASGNDPQNAKNGMKYSIIGFVLVMSAYAIIRFVQYLASTGG